MLFRSEAKAAENALAAERKVSEEKLAVLNRATEELRQAFKALSAEALQSNNQSFLQLAKTALETYQRQAVSTLDERIQRALAKKADVVESFRREVEAVKNHGDVEALTALRLEL